MGDVEDIFSSSEDPDAEDLELPDDLDPDALTDPLEIDLAEDELDLDSDIDALAEDDEFLFGEDDLARGE